MKRVGIYLRVSTGDQTTENQRLELEAVAARSGWEVVGFYEDAGISGAKGRDQRPAFDRLIKDATSRKINMSDDDRRDPATDHRSLLIHGRDQRSGRTDWHVRGVFTGTALGFP